MDDAVDIAMDAPLLRDESISNASWSDQGQVRRRIGVMYDGAILAKCQTSLDVERP